MKTKEEKAPDFWLIKFAYFLKKQAEKIISPEQEEIKIDHYNQYNPYIIPINERTGLRLVSGKYFELKKTYGESHEDHSLEGFIYHKDCKVFITWTAVSLRCREIGQLTEHRYSFTTMDNLRKVPLTQRNR